MRVLFVPALLTALIGTLFAANAQGAEVVVKAEVVTIVDEGVALRCSRKDDRNFKGYPLLKTSTPYVISLSWMLPQPDRVLVMLSEDQSSRMLLFASGVAHPPRAIGDDNPPPPPPGRARAPADHWSKVSALSPFKEGGRFFFMTDGWPRDFLFELAEGAGSPKELRFQVSIRGKEHAVRCELGR